MHKNILFVYCMEHTAESLPVEAIVSLSLIYSMGFFLFVFFFVFLNEEKSQFQRWKSRLFCCRLIYIINRNRDKRKRNRMNMKPSSIVVCFECANGEICNQYNYYAFGCWIVDCGLWKLDLPEPNWTELNRTE